MPPSTAIFGISSIRTIIFFLLTQPWCQTSEVESIAESMQALRAAAEKQFLQHQRFTDQKCNASRSTESAHTKSSHPKEFIVPLIWINRGSDEHVLNFDRKLFMQVFEEARMDQCMLAPLRYASPGFHHYPREDRQEDSGHIGNYSMNLSE
jgi:hypothetical protein